MKSESDGLKKRLKLLYFKKFHCKHFGHVWDTYVHVTGLWSYDIEQAGHCRRCGEDTHEEQRG